MAGGMVYILLFLVVLVVAAGLAANKGRSPVLWGALSIPLSFIAVLILLCLPKIEPQGQPGGGDSENEAG